MESPSFARYHYKMHVIIPTRNTEQTQLILQNAEHHFKTFGFRTVLVSTTPSAQTKPALRTFIATIPFSSSSLLMSLASKDFPIANEIIFGRNIAHLGFGGASNLGQLIAITTGLEQWLKIDDDCQIVEFRQDPRARAGGVGVGKLSELSQHPKDELIRRYSALAEQTRLDGTGAPFPVRYLKNGALLMSRETAMLAPYPVLFSFLANLSLRGEIYDWARQIVRAGGRFFEHEAFSVTHFRQTWSKNAWITQMLLKADVVFLHHASDVGGLVQPTERSRVNNLALIRKASEALDPRIFKPLINAAKIESEAMSLSKRALFESEAAITYWRKICSRSRFIRDEWVRHDDTIAEFLNWLQ